VRGPAAPILAPPDASDAPRQTAGAFLFRRAFPRQGKFLKEDAMFEGQPQEEVEALMQHAEFRQLYQRHKQLDRQVLDAELGVLAVDDGTLARMKREKLAAKDRLTRLYDVLHH
jgi:uncharacterized protein YdcH (DUF465 family)